MRNNGNLIFDKNDFKRGILFRNYMGYGSWLSMLAHFVTDMVDWKNHIKKTFQTL